MRCGRCGSPVELSLTLWEDMDGAEHVAESVTCPECGELMHAGHTDADSLREFAGTWRRLEEALAGEGNE